jgi:hypothetical protein
VEGGGRGLRAFLTPFDVIGLFVKLQVEHFNKILHSAFAVFFM